MAEVMAIGASAIAIIQITDRIVGLCKHYIETVRDAPSDLRVILLEVSALKAIFESLKFLTACDSGVSSTASAFSNLDGPVEGCLKSVRQLENLFPSNCIQDLGQNRSKKQKVKATLTALAWPLKETKARKLLDEISRYKTTITLAITAENAQDIKGIKAKTVEIHSLLTESQRHEVYRWLQHTDPSSLHFRARKDYEPGTGEWMLRTPEWISWLNARERCLWIHGIPGAGKTILMSYLIEQIKQHCELPQPSKCTYVYYYCYFGHDQDETAPFLRWLINQLCRQSDSVPGYVYYLYRGGGEPSFKELLEAVEEILGAFDLIYLAIDAVDESEPRDDMLEALRVLATDSRFKKLHLLVSSREYIEIETVMEDFSVKISMANTHVEEDIRRHVQSALQSNKRFKRWPQELLKETENAVSTGAKGMFRWAVCQIDVLGRLRYEGDNIEKALRNLPKTLDETYDRILLAFPEVDLVAVRHIFQWISYHNELYYGEGMPCEVLIQAVGKSTAELTANGLERFYDNDTLRELCGCLIKINQSESGTNNQVVSFAHYTVREYLDSSRSKSSKFSFAIRQEESTQNALISVFSEAQNLESNDLCECEKFPLDSDNLFHDEKRDFGDYCVVSAILSLHMWSDKISQHERIYSLAINLLDPSKPHFESLKHTASRLESHSDPFGATVSLPDALRITWHPETRSTIAAHLLNILLLADYETRCLSLAEKFLRAQDTRDFLQARLKFEKEVELVPADYSQVYIFDGSIIEVFAQLASEDPSPFNLLLEHSAGLFDPSKALLLYIGSHRHSSNYSCQSRYCPLTQLLDLGADPNCRGSRITPLQIAAALNDFNGVRTLLNAGADPNDTGSAGGSTWGENTMTGRFNNLYGVSTLYILRYYKTIRGPSRAEKFGWIEATLLKHGAKEFLRP